MAESISVASNSIFMNTYNNNKVFLPFALPSIGEDEILEVIDTLRSGWITTGPKTKKFEKEFASAVGVPFALAVSSGTAAMHLALEATGVLRGEYVITTPFTFTATAEVVRYFDANPLFVDIDFETMNINAELAAEIIDNSTKEKKKVVAIMPVHFAGLACKMSKITSLARKYSLKIVEDAAHAFPCSFGGKNIGGIGDMTCFSFYATKTISTAEGGMITTNSEQYAQRIQTMRLHGINKDIWDRYSSNVPNWYYEVVAPGYKYNLTDIAASIGIHQLKKADEFRKRREEIAKKYTGSFQGLPMILPAFPPDGDIHSWHLYVIRLCLDRFDINRDQFINLMAERGIGTSVHFIPLHLHPYWRNKYGFRPDDFPVALDTYLRCVSLPIYNRMTDDDVSRVIMAVKEIVSKYCR